MIEQTRGVSCTDESFLLSHFVSVQHLISIFFACRVIRRVLVRLLLLLLQGHHGELLLVLVNRQVVVDVILQLLLAVTSRLQRMH